MSYKTVKISDENYRYLLREASVLQQKYGVKVSLNDALSEITRKKNKSLLRFAGSISHETAEQIKATIAEMRAKDK